MVTYTLEIKCRAPKKPFVSHFDARAILFPVVRRDLCGGQRIADLHVMARKSDASVPW